MAAYGIQNICHMLRLRIPLNIEAKQSKIVVWKKGNIKYEALCLKKIKPESDGRMVWRCASKLRNDIFAVQNKQIYKPVTIENIMEVEAILPDKMRYTVNVLTIEELSLKKSGVIDSGTADVVILL